MLRPTNEILNLCSELVSVLYEDGFRRIHQSVANLEIISSTHATLLVERPLDDGVPVSIWAKGHGLYGIVEASEFDQTLGWFVRVVLDSTSHWHGRIFVPEHFLALGEPVFPLEAEAVGKCAC